MKNEKLRSSLKMYKTQTALTRKSWQYWLIWHYF